jgi:hypothetical protein
MRLEEGMTVTPKRMDVYDTQSKDVVLHRVACFARHHCDDRKHAMRVQYRVMLSTNRCTCVFTDHHKLHLVAALQSCDKLDCRVDSMMYSVAPFADALSINRSPSTEPGDGVALPQYSLQRGVGDSKRSEKQWRGGWTEQPRDAAINTGAQSMPTLEIDSWDVCENTGSYTSST